jgi:hypothetical protein
LLITLQLGGSGITLPRPAAELAHYVIDAYVAGDIEGAAKLQQQFSLFSDALDGFRTDRRDEGYGKLPRIACRSALSALCAGFRRASRCLASFPGHLPHWICVRP